ncbi:hypothetical protein L1987_33572 [Smallanthus sonchifolius]|uniref:Uncharacterized protein n=1 Tax=Smallanthus sonchifolius TaxID=185202 RepID=A0ACB9HSL3_9ASTR|nr:hypothetical protein L1987_33572 [Smallanthus sonchifolius]
MKPSTTSRTTTDSHTNTDLDTEYHARAMWPYEATAFKNPPVSACRVSGFFAPGSAPSYNNQKPIFRIGVVNQRRLAGNPVLQFKESNEEHRVDRFIRLQNFIKQCDGSDHRENIQLLLRLSPSERCKPAVELEKRAFQLTIEEGKEMQRMQALNILGKPSITRNPIPITKHTHHNI